MKEIFRPYPKHPKYLVSNMGRVMSLYFKKPRCLKPSKKSNGYLGVTLERRPKHMYVAVHRMVAETFLGPIPELKVINHKNFDRADNRLENLEVVSISENLRHSALAGRIFEDKHPMRKINSSIARQIKSMLPAEKSDVKLGRLFNVSRHVIYEIRNGVTWKSA